MDVIEQFKAILEKEKEDEIIPFLQGLDKGQKKDFIPALKKIEQTYLKFGPLKEGSNQYGFKATDRQQTILGISFFVCYNQQDFKKSYHFGTFKKEILDKVLPWYRPAWFGGYVNNYATDNFVPYYLDYDWYMDLVDEGYVAANNLLIAKILPRLIFNQLQRGYEYSPKNLLKRPITLAEHIWYIFDNDSTIHWNDRYADDTKESLWIKTFKQLADEKKIDRGRLLTEALKSANKNFNQSLTGWFIELFIRLEPSNAELLTLQSELLNTLNSTNSKPVNTALKYLKELCLEPEFLVDEFLGHAPLALTSETKTAVATTLMILEKLARKHLEQREGICLSACQAFIHQDNGLQTRAAKLIQKYGDSASAELKETIANYGDALFFDSRRLLAGFFESTALDGANDAPLETAAKQPATQPPELHEIPFPETFDDFVFLASQAFDQNEPYHFDLLPAGLLRFQGEMNAANIVKLLPAFQRAYKLLTSDFTSTRGYLDNMLAKFFMDYGKLLVEFYPQDAAPISEMRESFLKKEDEKKARWAKYQTRINSGIKQWQVYTHSLGYKPHKYLLLNAFFMLERKISLPLLSTPTHSPCYVSANTLIERLSVYQTEKIVPGQMDFQIALARCLIIDHSAALKLAYEKLKGEYRQLIGFVLGEEHHPQESYKLKVVWLVAALCRDGHLADPGFLACTELADDYLAGEFKWSSKVESYTYKQYDYKLKKEVELPGKRKAIRVDLGENQKKASVLKSLMKSIIPEKKEPEPSLFDCAELKFEYISAEHNDIERMLYLNPRKSDILIAHIINKCLCYLDFTGENDKKLVTQALQVLLTLNVNFGGMAHLLIATCMVTNDKTVRTYAAELWIKGVNESTIDSTLLGEIIGIHEQIELAPLKRFTDLILSNMFQQSALHNKELEKLLGTCIVNFPVQPINNLKKVLEIYAEVLSVNNTRSLKNEVLNKLNSWADNATLAKAANKIKNLCA